MRFFKILGFTILLSLASTHQVLASQTGVAATVQGQKIYETKLQKSIDSLLMKQGTNIGVMRDPKRYKKVREKVLNVLIGQELLWQAAKNNNILATDEEVNQAFSKYESQFDNEVRFKFKLVEAGFTKSTFQENLKQKLSAKKWLQQKIQHSLTVSSSDIHQFYVDNPQQFIDPEKVRARHILIKLSSTATDVEKKLAEKQLIEIKKELDSGTSFAQLAMQKSQGPSASKGGDLGFFERGKMVKPFETVAFSLKPGEISDITKTHFGLHLIKLVEHKPASVYEEKFATEQIKAYLLQQKSQLAVEKAIAGLRLKAKVEINNL